ncbi:MAG: hypothetical protein GX957_11415 [Clostridiaceae bacterium]|nr:hypothetical protein [Clostridiaceae bacterium]
MKLPIDRNAFSEYIVESNIFELTRKAMYICLENWYNDEPKQFVEDVRADFDTTIKTYHFYNEMVSFSKNFNFEPALDSIACIIRITDEDDDCCISYRAIFDYDLNIIDDIICP